MAIGLLAALAISAAIAAASQAVPTAQERENSKRLKELQRQQERGQLGLSGKERSVLEQGLLSPVKAAAREQRLRTGQQLAASGNVQPTDILRAGQMSEQNVGQAAMSASQTIQEEDLRRQRAQKQEIEDRLAFKAGEQDKILQAGMEGAAQGLQYASAQKLSSELPATKATEGLNPAILENAGFSPEEIQALMDYYKTDPETVNQILAMQR